MIDRFKLRVDVQLTHNEFHRDGQGRAPGISGQRVRAARDGRYYLPESRLP